MGVRGIGRYALFAAAALLLVALGYRLRPAAESPAATPGAAATATPTDAAGWRAAGESAFAAQRYPDAVAAYTRATALTPDDAAAWSALGEAQVQVDRTVSPAALTAFRRAVQIDPKDARARYFLAVRRDLDGDHKGAVADWTALLKDAPPGAPYAASVRALIMQTAAREHIAVNLPPAPPEPAAPAPGAMAGAPNAATDAIPGPSAAQLQDAARMSPTEQDAMARGMVDRLAARLHDNPRDAAGWMRLMRAKVVLGDQAGAKAALATARATFKGDAATTAQLDGAATALGL